MGGGCCVDVVDGVFAKVSNGVRPFTQPVGAVREPPLLSLSPQHPKPPTPHPSSKACEGGFETRPYVASPSRGEGEECGVVCCSLGSRVRGNDGVVRWNDGGCAQKP